MNYRKEIREFFENSVIGVENLTSENVATENRRFDPRGKRAFVEVRAAETGSRTLTETTTEINFVVVYTVCVEPGAGTERLDAIASAIQALFSPQDAARCSFGDERLHIVVRRVETAPAISVDGFYKKNVRVVFDAFVLANLI